MICAKMKPYVWKEAGVKVALAPLNCPKDDKNHW